MSLPHYFARAEEIARAGNASLQQILDRAMFDPFDHTTLGPGEGPEVRRRLRMVDWRRARRSEWIELFYRLRLIGWPAGGADGPFGERSLLRWLEERGLAAREETAA